MKIYVNEEYEIKAINESTDTTLAIHEIDRTEVFGNMSDFMILNYCYKVDDNGYSIYPTRNYSDIVEEDYKNKIDEQGDKISILEAENKVLQESQDIQDRTIVENDMRMMDIEWALEDLIIGINPALENKQNMEVFTMKLFEKGAERSSVYFNQLKQMIERQNYDSKEDMERILNKYASGTRPRITQEEYDQLFDMLYPPVYDITTEHTEA